MDPLLPDALFAPLVERIAAASGIRVPTAKRWLLSARVADRMRARGLADTADYVGQVLSEAGLAELGQLVEALRVGETRFFRHAGQLRAIRRIALPDILARREREGERIVRVWSAGCATGEEAYTLAMLLMDAVPAHRDFEHRVLATDLSERALEQARRGSYPLDAAANVPRHILPWAVVNDGHTLEVADAVRSRVRFEQRNLLGDVYPRGFDLVLCRNVLIYFDRATQDEVLTRLTRAVVPGGYLALGYADRPGTQQGLLTAVRTDEGVIFRRDDTVLATGAPPPREPAPRSRPSPSIRDAAPPSPAADDTPYLALSGALRGDAGEGRVRDIAGKLLRAQGSSVLDLRELTFADDGVARLLARTSATLGAEGRPLRIIAVSPGTVRFLRRHLIAPPASITATVPEDKP